MKETIEYQNIHGNRNHKDSLFRKVFRKKSDLLALYNAINGTCYENEDELEINTLDNALYMSVKNDVSCIVGCTMNLYEHQSSYNPNMPLRGLIYFAQLYNIYTEKRKLNLFSSILQKIPTPQYIVFYNGLKNEPDRQVLKLSDAITLSIDECIEKGILLDILTEERAEVFMYILESFDKELYERDLKENAIAEGLAEGRAQGLEEGRAEGRAEGRLEEKRELIKKKLAKGKSLEEIADALEDEVDVIKEIIKEME